MKPSADPAARAVDALADVRDQHQRPAAAARRRTARARRFSQVAIGTWNASSAGDERQRHEDDVAHQEIACACSCANFGLSGSAIEAEYTITRPERQQRHRDPDQRPGRSPARARALRHAALPRTGSGTRARAAEPEPQAMRRRVHARALQRHAGFVGERLHGGAEHLGAVRVVAEHVEAGAGRRHQHGVARLRALRRPAARPPPSMRRPAAATPAGSSTARISGASRPISTTARA